MTLLVKRLYLLLIIFMVTGCSKSDDNHNSNTSAPKLISFSKNTETYQISYDENEKPQTIMGSDNSVILIEYTNDKLTNYADNSYTYDSNGRLKTITKDNGTCTFTYNIHNLITKQDIVILDSFSGNPSFTIQRNLVYNGNNQLIEVTETNSDNSGIEKYTLTYNQNGKVIKLVSSFANDINTSYTDRGEFNLDYHSSRNPLQGLYEQMGLQNNITFINIPQLNANNLSNISIGYYNYFKIYLFSKNNLSNIDIIAYSNANLNITDSYNYLIEDNYPISADLTTSTINDSFTTQLTWQYSDE